MARMEKQRMEKYWMLTDVIDIATVMSVSRPLNAERAGQVSMEDMPPPPDYGPSFD
jgi:hypothetical protein